MAIEGAIATAASKAATSEIVKGIFKNLINPLISSKLKDFFDATELEKLKENLDSYLNDLEDKCSNVNTIAFGNCKKKIEEIYEPLTLVSDPSAQETKVTEKTNIFKNHKKILLTDRAGMGKTTLSKRVVLNEILRQKEVPIFVELRRLNDANIKKYLKSLIGVNEKVSDAIFGKLPFLYVFDGIDEIPNSIKNDLIKNICEFSDEIKDSKLLITSRHEADLSLFSNVERYSIKPLEKEEAFSLIRRYDKKNEIHETLIKEIKSNKNSIHEFLSTPLYVSLLFCAYRHKTSIPKKNYMFYNQVYDALYEAHDLSKQTNFIREKHSKLDSQDFHKILRYFAFNCLANNGEIEYQTDELGIEINKAIDEVSNINVSASEFIKDMTETVPLFIKEGCTIRWSHKSLMEYFAAMFICSDAKSNQKDILLHFYNHDNWRTYTNLLELCADIDYSTFRTSIIKPTLENYLKYKATSYQEIKNKRIKSDEITRRQALTFASRLYFRIHPEGDGYEEPDDNFKNPFIEVEHMFAEKDLGRVSFSNTVGGPKHVELGLFVTRASIPIKILRSKKNMPSDKKSNGLSELKTIKNKRKIQKALNDDPKCLLNNSVNFSTINKAIEALGSPYIPDEIAEIELQAIEVEIKNSSQELMKKLKKA